MTQTHSSQLRPNSAGQMPQKLAKLMDNMHEHSWLGGLQLALLSFDEKQADCKLSGDIWHIQETRCRKSNLRNCCQ